MPAFNRLHKLSDDDLMKRIGRQDTRAMELLMERHQRVVYALAMRMLQDSQSAEDVAQAVFLNLWRKAGQYSPGRGSVRTWLLGSTRNAAIDEMRRNERQLRGSVTYDGDVPETMNEQTIEGSTLEPLDSLPSEQRQVVWMAVYGGYTHVEISDMLSLPLGTVKSRMRLGLQRLRNSYNEDGDYALSL